MQLGDAHAARAERDARDCDRLPDERACPCLQRSEELFRQSITWFDRVEASPESSRALLKAHAALAAVSERLAQLMCE